MGIFGWNLKLFAWCSVQLLSKLPLCSKFMWLNSYAASMLGIWSKEHGRTAIVMQMRKVEATQERRDEPRGSITLVFHHGPESICLKIKRGRTPLRSALRSPRTAHITCDFHYPTCVSLCGKGDALCQTVSHWFLPAESQRPKGDSYRPMDCVLIGKN